MTELRWILLVLGAGLLAGIWLWGRRRGQAAPTGDRLAETRRSAESDPADLDTRIAARWQSDRHQDTLTDLPAIHSEGPHDLPPDFAAPLDLEREPGFQVEPEPEGDLVRDDEPLLGAGDDTDEVRAAHQAHQAHQEAPSPPSRPPPTRKIVAIRLTAAMAQRYEGVRLRGAMQSAGLTHGKYGIFHRLESDGSVFSVASLVEPGSFDLDTMDTAQYAGVTLFAVFPGPLRAAAGFDQLLECARYLERTLGGTLQDEQGEVLTPQRADQLRDEVLDYAHLQEGHRATENA